MSQKTDIQVVLQSVNAKSVAKYALLPGITNRLRSLSRAVDGFLFMFTQLFGACGLIPRNHPCLQVSNVGRFRFTDIIGLAARNVVFDKKHLPQTLMFFAIIGTIVISIATAIVSTILIVLSVPAAQAQLFGDSTDDDYIKRQDWAYQFLGEIFGRFNGMDGMFGGVWENGAQHPPSNMILKPILEAMFSAYSEALLVIAAFMVIYLIITMVADAARSGQPFGSNFNSVWAPIRLALAIGLLVPVMSGYNGAQLIAFQVANWGSALGTNVWIRGLSAFSNPTASGGKSPGQQFLAMSQPDDGYRFMRGLFLMDVCVEAVNKINMSGQMGGSLLAGFRKLSEDDPKYQKIDASIVEISALRGFAVLNSDYCGQFKLPTPVKPVALSIEGVQEPVNGNELQTVTGPRQLGALPRAVSEAYIAAFKSMQPILRGAAQVLVEERMCTKDKAVTELAIDNPVIGKLHLNTIQAYRNALGYSCPSTAKSCTFLNGSTFSNAAESDGAAIIELLNSGKRYGWASAGSFMLMLSYANDLMSSAVNSPPEIVGMPRPLSNPVSSPTRRNATVDDTAWYEDAYNWVFGATSRKDDVQKINNILWEANTWFVDWPADPNSCFTKGQATDQTSFDPDNQMTNAPGPRSACGGGLAPKDQIDLDNWRASLNDQSQKEQFNGGGQISPLDGVFGGFMRNLIVVNQNDVNPIAKVVAIGSALFYLAAGITTAGLIANFWLPGMIQLALSVALPLTIAAYTLAVVLPCALFFNFLFAVIEWVVSVFEAVLGMPLWALSFITTGGDGIGDKAMSGIMMLFEIMLRPTIIVIVTVASFIIFAGSVHFFNKAFGLYYRSYMLNTTSGGSLLMSVGSIFMYVMCVYSIGNSSFKLIPTIANNFMRWIGGQPGFSNTMQFDLNQVSGLAGFIAARDITNSLGSAIGGQADRKFGNPAQDARSTRRHEAAVKKQQTQGRGSLSRTERQRVDRVAAMSDNGNLDEGIARMKRNHADRNSGA